MISCLTLTYNRLNLFKEAVKCFDNQTYKDKELVVVCDGDASYKSQVRELLADRKDVVLVEREKGLTLGELRNLSVGAANGDIVCQWDDDEFNHPQRLEIQLKLMGQSKAHCFNQHLRLVQEDKKIYLLKSPSAIMGTLMAKRDTLLAHPYAPLKRGEDSVLAKILNNAGLLSVTDNPAWLHIYVFHGQNTWDIKHQREMIQALGQKITPEFIQQVEKAWPKLSSLLSDPTNTSSEDSIPPVQLGERDLASLAVVSGLKQISNSIHQFRQALQLGIPSNGKHPTISAKAFREATGQEGIETINKLTELLGY